MHPTTATNCGQDYEYHVSKDGDTFNIVVEGYNGKEFDGTLAQFDEFVKKQETVEAE